MIQSSFLFATITNLDDKITKLTSSIYGTRLQVNLRDRMAKKYFSALPYCSEKSSENEFQVGWTI